MHSCVSFDVKKQVLFWRQSLSPFCRSSADARLLSVEADNHNVNI